MEDSHVALEGMSVGGDSENNLRPLHSTLPPLPEVILEALEGLGMNPSRTGVDAYPAASFAAAAPVSSSSQGDHKFTTSLYAVLDGHGGKLAADYAAGALPRRLIAHPQFWSSGVTGIMTALREAFLETDAEFMRVASSVLASAKGSFNQSPWLSGSTALVAVIRGADLVIASLGDCRAVLATPVGGTLAATANCMRGGGGGADNPSCFSCQYQGTALNNEHTPSSEIDRIQRAGGWVVEAQEFSRPDTKHMDTTNPFVARRIAKDGERLMRWTSVSHVNNELAVARALGDIDFKGERMNSYQWCWPRGMVPREFVEDLVLGEPDIKHFDLAREWGRGGGGVRKNNGGGDDATASGCRPFLILACDGLWEVLSSQEAVEIVVSALRGAAAIGTTPGEHAAACMVGEGGEVLKEGNPCPPIVAARHLVDIAIRLGTSDNVTAIVVLL